MKQTIQDLIANDKTKQAIEQLRRFTAENDDLYQQVLLLSSRFIENERQRHGGMVGHDTITQEHNSIKAALLAVAGELGADNRSRYVFFLKEASWVRIGGALVTFIAVLAGIAEFSGYSMKDLFTKEKIETSIVKPPANSSGIKDTIKDVSKPPKLKQSAPRNYFESRDQSKQVNISDNQGTININQ